MYKIWIDGGDIWLDESFESGNDKDNDGEDDSPDDVCCFAAGLQQIRKGCSKDQNPEIESESSKEDNNDSNFTCTYSTLRKNTGAQKDISIPSSICAGVCESGLSANKIEQTGYIAPTGLSPNLNPYSFPQTFRKLPQTSAKVRPLPGVLDHRDFERVTKELGKCSLCGGGKAVFYSGEFRMGICEGCFARLLREECLKDGVR